MIWEYTTRGTSYVVYEHGELLIKLRLRISLNGKKPVSSHLQELKAKWQNKIQNNIPECLEVSTLTPLRDLQPATLQALSFKTWNLKGTILSSGSILLPRLGQEAPVWVRAPHPQPQFSDSISRRYTGLLRSSIVFWETRSAYLPASGTLKWPTLIKNSLFSTLPRKLLEFFSPGSTSHLLATALKTEKGLLLLLKLDYSQV